MKKHDAIDDYTALWAAVFIAAKRLGIPDATARQWYSRGYVPANEQHRIVKEGVNLGFSIDHDTLQRQREDALNRGKKK